jgi:RNA polymerase sigma factor for flagellar operon FliA
MANGLRAYQQAARRNQQDELILSHLPLVRHVLGRLAIELPPGIDLENLEAAGALGLVEAAQHFDPTLNVQFKTYAYTRIRGAMLDELRRNSPLPQHMQEKVALVARAYAGLPAPVTLEQLCQATGLSSDDVADALAAMRFTRQASAEAGPDDPADPNASSPAAGLEEEEARRVLVEAVEGLPPQERLVVTLYYKEEMRLKEISAVMQLSESRLSRLLSAALLTLRERLRVRES